MTEAQGAGGEGSGAAARRGGLARRVGFVRDLAEKMTAAVDLDALGEVVSAELRRGLGVSAVILNLLSEDGTQLTTVVAEGAAEATKELLARPIPLEDETPAKRALEAGTPILWSSIASRDKEYPRFLRFPSRSRSWAVLPLIVRGRPIGTLSLGWPESRRFGRVETAILELIAHHCALALDRARLDRVRQAERSTLELLSEGTRLMVSALEPARVVEALVHLAVPRLAPWCAVYVGEGRTLRRVAIEIEGAPDLADALRGLADVQVDSDVPIAYSYRTGVSSVVYPIEPEVVRAIYARDHADVIIGQGEEWTGMTVPIRALGDVIGVITLVSPEWGGRPPEDVRFAAEGLAGRAGVALANARLFQDERELAAQLMEAFLPAELPAIPGYDLAARYQPAGARVAGDWYDVVRLPKDRFLVGIGDAGGHGIHAASLMGQLRNSARGLALTGHSPAAVIEALQLLTSEDHPDSFATALYGELDLESQAVHWAGAGHVPVLAFDALGARFLDRPTGQALGWPAARTAEWQMPLEPGGGIVLVTDGVVERRGTDLETGMARLRDLVAAHAGLDAARLSARIVEERCATAEDDCCVLVLRRR